MSESGIRLIYQPIERLVACFRLLYQPINFDFSEMIKKHKNKRSKK